MLLFVREADNKSLKSNPSGFTLIELLITISVIAVLAVIGMIVYTSVLQQGRDSKRQSDLRTIQSALEQYRADQGFYAGSLPLPASPLRSPDGSKTYLNQMPQEPLSSPQYGYNALPMNCDNSSVKCTSYCIYAHLENNPPGIGNCPPSSSYNFTVTPP